MAVSQGCFHCFAPLLFLLFFVFCVCTGQKVSPDLPTWKAEIEEQIHRLQKDNQKTQSTNQILVDKVERLERRLTELETERSKMEEVIEKQNEKLRFLESLYTSQSVLDDHEETVMSHERSAEGNEDSRVLRISTLPGATAKINEPIVFHSYLSGDSLPNLSEHHVITFDLNPVNKGNGYHKDNGIFEAPRAGTYVFFWSIYTWPRGFIRTELLVNGYVIGGALADAHPDDGINSGTGVAIADLWPGDHVYVRLSATAENYILSHSDARSTFSGWLLH